MSRALTATFSLGLLVALASDATAQWGGWGGWGTGLYVPTQMGRAHATVRNVPYRVGKWELPKPVGTYVPKQPPGATARSIGGKPYWHAGSDFYIKHGAGFVVVTPPIGGVLDRVPIGAQSVRIGSVEHHYYSGAFVRRGPAGFEVVPAPVGAVVDRLPDGARKTMVDGKRHHVHDGVYYRPYYRGSAVVYKVVEPPLAPKPGRGK